MNRFLSHATNRIDAKGRVSVPSAFRAVLSEAGVRELYCFQDFVFPAISVGGPELLERFERQMAAEDPFSDAANQMSLLVHGGGIFLKLDPEGRLMITDFIRDFTGIATEVAFVGRGDHFQLWEPQAFARAQAEAREGRTQRGLRPS
ncbi:division/cell wall cluster transcriptional repressor MraZ [Sinorhizobium alkalisoli]|uniref:Transcriptional regulator MraZ n=1 Tax=Sinorhizobium alkalisoli TaxID=1752398 RepID=A0A1E3V400_9HYPH|nr:division/cell wall cluster transcriptional repressor MraZ [Sinorhizobium alkalisoli]MCA1491647.1 division/cell wall cluster transcriptional repressor MraZ [Ensifer sp. NBAIM29]MCG5482446.1 division/cell wall cluster transcriptional repressor MraZ [Sinorhizobium meliloti]ODR88215.1 cell division/cell wall cluster transcriptional repressor MraZ [Sinorhizobium alkalisoli]QFI67058.1 Cell division protein MraZ [Sinorhizobium alkalisoli]